MTGTGKICLDASNIHEGGALQVATSLLDEFAIIARSCDEYRWLSRTKVLVSPQLMKELRQSTVEALTVVQVAPRGRLPRFTLRAPGDLCLQIFGPVYNLIPPKRSITGYADVTAILGTRDLSRSRLVRARGFLSRRLIKRSTVVVVESEWFASRVIETTGVSSQSIRVIPNSLGAGFLRGSPVECSYRPLAGPVDYLFGYVARGYPHKNHRFLGALGYAFETKFKKSAKFVVTLTDHEWSALSSSTRRYCINVGPLRSSELQSFYRSVDAIVFPSLLESYSASPIESMFCGTPVFASDRDFMTSLFGSAVSYIDPFDAEDAAVRIVRWFHNDQARTDQLREMRTFVDEVPSSTDRAMRYLALLDEQLRDAGLMLQ